ncbi:MAG TPA: hypothetical protein DCE78_01780 [Bacteroidetes bacterium]|nr:hypothetical protein [Bacteroidota bacterium]
MKKNSRLAMGLAALLLIPLYFMPFWSIKMSAPQYPGGIGMYISIDDVTGHNKHDLKSINTLNHYIGMAEINKEDFKEFEVMPYVFLVMIFLGLLAAFTGSYRLTFTWLILMVLIGIIGFIDFYMWGYDYGHNLSPDAPIKVPGMSYQPPLFGCKQLLNINACSIPHTGSIFLGLSLILASVVLWKEKK